MNAVQSNTNTPLFKDHEGLVFWFNWVLANTFGLSIGQWISGRIYDVLWPIPHMPPNSHILQIITNPFPATLIAGLIIGTLIGFFELHLLRTKFPKTTWKWMASSALICMTFPAIPHLMFSWNQHPVIDIVTLISGFTLGIMQWNILRKMVNNAGWWILVRVFTFPLIFWAIKPAIANSGAGVLAGGITGGVLLFLLQKPFIPENIQL